MPTTRSVMAKLNFNTGRYMPNKLIVSARRKEGFPLKSVTG